MAATMTRTGALACPPAFGTPRNLDRLTLGPQAGEVARRLRLPLMPWQQHVLDVALELDPSDGGLVYPELILTTPRQQGKTALVLAKLVHRANAQRAFSNPGALEVEAQHILYTAQDRNHARKKWLEDHVARLLKAKSSFREGRDYEIRLSNGSEQIEWTNGSRHGVTAPTEAAGHSETLDEAVIDEAFYRTDSAVEDGVSPAMITRRNRQLFVLSTAGNAKSVYLWRKVLAGRLEVVNGTNLVCYFEWSAPEDADPHDPDVWRAANPAWGITVTERSLRAEHDRLMLQTGGLKMWQRAHLNQWPDKPVLEEQRKTVIDMNKWALCGADPETDMVNPVTLSIAVSTDQRSACIAASGRTSKGVAAVDAIEHHAGTDWVIARLAELVRKHKPAALYLDPSGPTGVLLPEMTKRTIGIEPTELKAREMAQACGLFLKLVDEGNLRHVNQSKVNFALDGATKKSAGGGLLWVWDQRDASVDISPLVAVTIALWGAASAPAVKRKPVAGPSRAVATANEVFRPTSRLKI